MAYTEFIEEMRLHPELYDKNHKNYMNTKWKDYLWRTFDQKFHFEGGSKKKWTYLRDKYVKDLRKFKTMSSPIGDLNTYKFMEAMDFLNSYIKPRKTSETLWEETTQFSESAISLNQLFCNTETKWEKESTHTEGIENKIEYEIKNTSSISRKRKYLASGFVEEIEDSDELFLKSLIPDMKRLSASAKMAYKIAILNSLKNALETDTISKQVNP